MGVMGRDMGAKIFRGAWGQEPRSQEMKGGEWRGARAVASVVVKQGSRQNQASVVASVGAANNSSGKGRSRHLLEHPHIKMYSSTFFGSHPSTAKPSRFGEILSP